jgi:hypothetical protein
MLLVTCSQERITRTPVPIGGRAFGGPSACPRFPNPAHLELSEDTRTERYVTFLIRPKILPLRDAGSPPAGIRWIRFWNDAGICAVSHLAAVSRRSTPSAGEGAMRMTRGNLCYAVLIGLVTVAVAGCGGAGGPDSPLGSIIDPPGVSSGTPTINATATGQPLHHHPEPSTFLLIGSGLAGLAYLRSKLRVR